MASLDVNFYNQLKGMDLYQKDDNYFRSLGVGWDRGRQDAIDWMHVMRQSDPAEIAKREAEKQKKLAEQQKLERENLFTQGKQELTDFTGRFQEKADEVQTEIFDKFDIPGKVDAVNALKSAITDRRMNLSNQGAGGYANTQQVERAVSSNLLPAQSLAADALASSTTAAMEQANFALKPILTEGQLLNDFWARQVSSFDNEKQRELDGLLNIARMGMDATISQWEQMYDYAAREMQYAFEREKLDKELAAKKDEGGDLVSVGKGSFLFNPITGEWLTPPGGGSSGGDSNIFGGGSRSAWVSDGSGSGMSGDWEIIG